MTRVTRMKNVGSIVLSTIFSSILFLAAAAAAGSSTDPIPKSKLDTGQTAAQISIDEGRILRESLPETFFGFNIRWERFEKDLWDSKNDRVKDNILENLTQFDGALYRYPGGLVANEYGWEESVLPKAERKSINKNRKWRERAPLFGVDEFFDFVEEVKGSWIYTLNLVGKGKTPNVKELPEESVAQSNKELARYIVSRTQDIDRRYYQLGNELDRSHYEWSHKKYISRSKATINSILEVDKNARFVAFLRDFNWKYRGGKKGKSLSDDFIRDVLGALPMVNDYSLHFYYDGELRPGGRYLDIQRVVNKINHTLEVANQVGSDKEKGVWITEHSRRIIVNRENEEKAKLLTTGLGGALGTADFLIAMAQIPQVKGTSLQALNGVSRQVFDASVKYGDLRPTPVYWAQRILNDHKDGQVLETRTKSENNSEYPGGYDVRAVALSKSPESLTVWVVNRYKEEQTTDILYTKYRGRAVNVKHYYLSGKSGEPSDKAGQKISLELEPETDRYVMTDRGAYTVKLPPSSVSVFEFQLDDPIQP